MPLLKPEHEKQVLEAAFADKTKGESYYYDAYHFADPLNNPWASESSSTGSTNPDVFFLETPYSNEHLYDGTLQRAVEKLVGKIIDSPFPVGEHWASFKPAEEGDGPLSEENSNKLASVEKKVFKAIHASRFQEQLVPTARDSAISGTGVLNVGWDASVERVVFESVNQCHVAFSRGVRDDIWGYYRKKKMTRDMIFSMWPRTTKRVPPPEDMEKEKTSPEYIQVYESTYYDPKKRIWHYSVMVDKDGPIRIHSQIFPVSPWMAFRWDVSAGQVQGTGPVFKALPTARMLNGMAQSHLDSVWLQSRALITYKGDANFNPGVVKIGESSMIRVQSNDPRNPTLAPLILGGNVQYEESTIRSLQDDIEKIMLIHPLPAITDPVKTATEILAGREEARMSLGRAALRLVSEIAIPVLRAVLWHMFKAGKLPELQEAFSNNEQMLQAPFKLDGSDIRVEFQSPLVQEARLGIMRSVSEWAQTCIATMGEEKFREILSERFAKKLLDAMKLDSDWMGTPEEIEENRARNQEQAQPQQGAANLPQQIPQLGVV